MNPCTNIVPLYVHIAGGNCDPFRSVTSDLRVFFYATDTLEHIDTRIISVSNMCRRSASTETVGVASDTREIISRPFVFLKYF